MRAYRRTKTAAGIIGAIIAVLALFIGIAAWCGFLVMILCGVLWHVFGILKPIGFLPALGIGVLLSLLSAAVRGGGS